MHYNFHEFNLLVDIPNNEEENDDDDESKDDQKSADSIQNSADHSLVFMRRSLLTQTRCCT